jgi:catechol 2,3-dioxygenase-like lactoylglutathione lyase family enzyme
MLSPPKLIPELDVDDLKRSLAFYTGTVGFRVLFGRREDRFAYLDLEGVHLMLEELGGSGRYFTTAPLAHPYGRGVNFQIQIADVNALYKRVVAGGFPVPIPLEERWYRQDAIENGNRQFVVADPDGYLLRFFTNLGQRPTPLWASRFQAFRQLVGASVLRDDNSDAVLRFIPGPWKSDPRDRATITALPIPSHGSEAPSRARAIP